MSRTEPRSKERTHATPPAIVPTPISVDPPPTSQTATSPTGRGSGHRAFVGEPPLLVGSEHAHGRAVAAASATSSSPFAACRPGAVTTTSSRGQELPCDGPAPRAGSAVRASPPRCGRSLDLVAEPEVRAFLEDAGPGPGLAATRSRTVFEPTSRLPPARLPILDGGSVGAGALGALDTRSAAAWHRRAPRAPALAHQRVLRGAGGLVLRRARAAPRAVLAELPCVSFVGEQHVEHRPSRRWSARPRPVPRPRAGGRGCAASGRRCRAARSRLLARLKVKTRLCSRKRPEDAAHADRSRERPGNAGPQRADASARRCRSAPRPATRRTARR